MGEFSAMSQKTSIPLCLAAGLCRILLAKEAVVGPLARPFFADTEVATNFAFNAARSDVTAFDVRMDLAGTVSNCVQAAFGRDADGDGDLAPEETALVLGWRGGGYFVEDVVGGVRLVETNAAPGGVARFLHLSVAIGGDGSPRTAAFTNEVGACFADLSEDCPPWLFRGDWNLLKMTRRGVDPADELFRIRNRYRSFHLVFR